MGQRSTPNSLELYLYACNETGLAESDRVQRAIDGDPLTDYRHVIMLMRLPG